MVTTRKKPKIPPAVAFAGEKQPQHTQATISSVYGARYLDARTSRWISADPALGEYIPAAPLGDEEKKRNQNLPGMGGVFNYVNLHVYHYAANNPVKYVDPDGRNFYNFSRHTYIVRTEGGNYVRVEPDQMYQGKIDGAVMFNRDSGDNIEENTAVVIKVSGASWLPTVSAEVRSSDVPDRDDASLVGRGSRFWNGFIDSLKGKNSDLSGVYRQEEKDSISNGLKSWVRDAKNILEGKRDVDAAEQEKVVAVDDYPFPNTSPLQER